MKHVVLNMFTITKLAKCKHFQLVSINIKNNNNQINSLYFAILRRRKTLKNLLFTVLGIYQRNRRNLNYNIPKVLCYNRRVEILMHDQKCWKLENLHDVCRTEKMENTIFVYLRLEKII